MATELSSNFDYRVNVDVFEGPLDLLVHLIKKNDLDIYDIPIAFVLEEYMKYLDSIRELDIDLAGDFLLMAAELAHIKSRMLLPEENLEEEEELDPRSDLVRRLIEYQQFKLASEALVKRSILWRDVFKPLRPQEIATDGDGPIEAQVYDLVEAFSRILKKIPAEKMHEVSVDRISINDRIYQIVALVKKDTAVMLTDLFTGEVAKYDVVITFLALLEMARLKMIKVYQNEVFGQIYLQGVMENVKEEDVVHLIEVEAKGFEKKDQ